MTANNAFCRSSAQNEGVTLSPETCSGREVGRNWQPVSNGQMMDLGDALEQLTKFYAPILGMSSALAAHRRGDEMLKEAGSKAHHEGWKKDVERKKSGRWAEYIESSMETTEIIKKFFDEELPARFTNERVEMYIRMRDFFTQNFGFADEDTRVKYYGNLYDEVEKMRVYRDSVAEGTFLPGDARDHSPPGRYAAIG